MDSRSALLSRAAVAGGMTWPSTVGRASSLPGNAAAWADCDAVSAPAEPNVTRVPQATSAITATTAILYGHAKAPVELRPGIAVNPPGQAAELPREGRLEPRALGHTEVNLGKPHSGLLDNGETQG